MDHWHFGTASLERNCALAKLVAVPGWHGKIRTLALDCEGLRRKIHPEIVLRIVAEKIIGASSGADAARNFEGELRNAGPFKSTAFKKQNGPPI